MAIKFLNTVAVDTNVLYVDAINNRVGIGTTSPAEKLYVNSISGDARIGLNAPTGSDTEIKFSNNGVVQYSIGHDDATDNFVIGTANVDTPKVSIDKAGNVGIGTTGPGYPLDVVGIIKTSTSFLGTTAIIQKVTALNANGIQFTNNGGSEKMRITDGGNVGIGTTSPSGLLHIKKDNALATFEIQGGLNTQTTAGAVNGEINFGVNDPSTTGGIGASIKNISQISNGAHNGLAFFTGLQSRTPYLQQMLYFTAQGGLSFGTTNTAYGTSGQILKSNADAPPSWVNASTVIGGPYLPLTGGTMTGTNGVLMPDLFKLKFGDATTPDLEIYHDGSNSYIKDNGTGTLNLQGSTQVLIGGTNGEVGVQYVENAGVGLRHNNVAKLTTESTGVAVVGNITVDSALLSNQENTDIDTGAEVVAQVAHATYTAAFFDFVVKKGTNVRSGTVYACHNGDTTPLVEFTETSTQDLGDTSDVVLSVDISSTQMRLLATVTSDDWSVKSLIRAI